MLTGITGGCRSQPTYPDNVLMRQCMHLHINIHTCVYICICEYMSDDDVFKRTCVTMPLAKRVLESGKAVHRSGCTGLMQMKPAYRSRRSWCTRFGSPCCSISFPPEVASYLPPTQREVFVRARGGSRPTHPLLEPGGGEGSEGPTFGG